MTAQSGPPSEKPFGLPPEVLEFSGDDNVEDTERLIKLISRAKKLVLSNDPAERQAASDILELVSYRLSILQSDFQE